MNNGQVKLQKGDAKIIDMMQALNSEFAPMIDVIREEWIKNDVIFNSTSDIIKAATGRERLKKDKYIFVEGK